MVFAKIRRLLAHCKALNLNRPRQDRLCPSSTQSEVLQFESFPPELINMQFDYVNAWADGLCMIGFLLVWCANGLDVFAEHMRSIVIRV